MAYVTPDLVESRLELALFAQILRGGATWIGRQVVLGDRRRADIVFCQVVEGGSTDGARAWVVVEVKAQPAGWAAFEQLAGYVMALAGVLDIPATDGVMGVLAAPSFDPDLRATMRRWREQDGIAPVVLHNCSRLLARVA